jgi:uncharacterized iron-regulated membrane protein
MSTPLAHFGRSLRQRLTALLSHPANSRDRRDEEHRRCASPAQTVARSGRLRLGALAGADHAIDALALPLPGLQRQPELLPDYFGLQFVGWMGVAMVLFGISGLVLWWPKKGQWRLAFGVKRGARGFRLNRDLHGAAGFWSLTVFLILSVSGVDLAFPITFQNMVGAVLPLDSGVADGTIDEATIASIANRNALTVDDAAKLALAAVPDARLLSIQLPSGGNGIYMVAMNPEPYGNGAPQISAFVGPGAEVSSIVDPRTYSLGKRI